jgi:putative flavoprotein involved in K+ transport
MTVTEQHLPSAGPSAELSEDGAGERRTGTAVVGAGQAGLATAFFLTRAGHDCLVLDENPHVGDQWRRRWDSLQLNTPARWDRLPGTPFPAPPSSFPTGRQLADYLEAYAAEHRIEVLPDAPVERVRRLADGRWSVTGPGTRVLADQVVVATGGETHPRRPGFADRLDPGTRQLHSSEYHRPGDLLPGPVLVVGASQSGADLALECARSGHETWLSGPVKGEIPFPLGSMRQRLSAPVLWFLVNHVLTVRTPMGRKAKARVRAGGTPLVRVRRDDLRAAGVRHLEARTTGVDDAGRPVLADGTVLEVANVLWCTGFGQDFGLVDPPVTGPDGWPRDDGGIVPEAPGLYFAGLIYQRGFYSMLVGGAGRDARHVARHILRRAASARRTSPAG